MLPTPRSPAFVLLSTILLMLFAASSRLAAAATEGETFFTDKIAPVLTASCIECHGEKKQKAHLRLDSAEALGKGGEDGVVVVPGDPGKSLLITAISHTDPDLKMPPKKKLSDEQIADFTKWVELGAPWAAGVELKKKR